MEYLTRSKAAFRMSADSFIEQAHAERKKCYLWTFTFRQCVDVKTAFAAWSKFANRLYQWGIKAGTEKYRQTKDGKWKMIRGSGEQTIVGLRVAEMHPGGHGVHFHVLINRYINIHIVRRIAARYGFGRDHVVPVKRGKAGDLSRYLSKYLSKSDRPECFKGRRIWQAFGKWGQTRCKDVVIESEFVAAFKARRKILEVAKRVHEQMGIAYRVESNLETMEHANHHVMRVSLGLREPLRPDLWHSPPDEDPPRRDFADWEGEFAELTHGRN